MRAWALPLLRCLKCGHSLELGPEAVVCPQCGARYPITDDIADFLPEPNAVVARERAAVATLDGGAADPAGPLRELLGRLDRDPGSLRETDLVAFPCVRHAMESREQIQELLEREPLPAEATVLELGADHCWTSNLILDAGCRVIASDITDHMRLATRAADPSLCRLQADMNGVPLGDGVVDVVWATAAAHHSWDLERTFREAHRVLKPRGLLYFCCEPMPSWVRYWFGKDFGHEQRALGINETWIPRSSWLGLARKVGFEPRVVLPALGRAAIEERLARHRLPRALALAAAPFLRLLQVSIHLVARKH